MFGLFEFRVISRTKTATAEGTKFRVKLKSGEGHIINLVSDSSEIFKGFPIDERVPVEIRRVQTLEEVAG